MTPIAIGFLPLTDSAVLVTALEKGFAREAGIDLTLVKSTSWATQRDRLIHGQVQAAQMLAPLAVAVTLGLSQEPVSLAAPFKLNLNGNALVMASDFAAALEPDRTRRVEDPLAAAHDFATAIGLHRRKPVIGIVHRFSSHALALRYWLASAGIDPDRDIQLQILPPSLMVEAVRGREIDGFIAGEPWSSVAVAQGLGEIVALGSKIWQRGVEKVLAFRTDWLEAHSEITDPLLRALSRAASWCEDPRHHQELAALLAQEQYVGQLQSAILPALTGRLQITNDGPLAIAPDFLLFHREATAFPWQSQALWIYSQLVRWRFLEASADAERRSADVFRPDVYRRALGATGEPMPGASMKVEGAISVAHGVGSRGQSLILGPDRFFDGRSFDPDNIARYLDSLSDSTR